MSKFLLGRTENYCGHQNS